MELQITFNNKILSFVSIESDCLIKGNKYIIIQSRDYNNVIKKYIGIFVKYESKHTVWKKIDIILETNNGNSISSSTFHLQTFNLNLNTAPFKIYKLIKTNIQEAMEIIAINIILQNIIGTFIYQPHFPYNPV